MKNKELAISNISKVKFCYAWLNTIVENEKEKYTSPGIVIYKGTTYNSMQRNHFLECMVKDCIISEGEKEDIIKEWVDITDCRPYLQ